MSWSKRIEFLRVVAFPGIVISAVLLALWIGAAQNNTSAKTNASAVPSATFAGTGVGNIPDATACGPTPGTPLNVSFNVTGISTAPSNVSVDFTAGTAHTWVGDLIATLISPDGTSHSIFGRTGATTATALGTGNNLVAAGVYTYNNAAAGSWWTVATSTASIPGGAYRTSNVGGAGATNPMPATDMNAAFAGIPTSNGTWTLRFTDGCNADTGSISAANLVVEGAVVVPTDAPNDLNGDGKTDYVIVRANVPGFSGTSGENHQGRNKVRTMRESSRDRSLAATVTWWAADSTNGNSLGTTDFGDDLGFFLTNDYDNDGKDDLTTWTGGASGVAGFHILLSSTSTVSNRLYGQDGDDPTIGGDWNGDGKADLSVFRDTAGTFFWSDETTPTSVNYLPWGTTNDIAFSLDYDGDGKADAAVQRDVGGAGQFWIRRSSDNGVYVVNYGLSSDFVVPGDYDGDGRDDICVSRNADLGDGVRKYFWILESDGGGAPASPYQWGLPGDFISQGDYDGDGKTDIAVWRPNADPTQNYFYVRKSSDAGLQQFEWGAQGDYPINNWNVH
ncbi:MAG TPA: VCBS repeat-containing protein [Pyrinomonadaceae bacterium]|nr:VCBS repeat-containing protein [Pyrinomonadaceae bacterium]